MTEALVLFKSSLNCSKLLLNCHLASKQFAGPNFGLGLVWKFRAYWEINNANTKQAGSPSSSTAQPGLAKPTSVMKYQKTIWPKQQTCLVKSAAWAVFH